MTPDEHAAEAENLLKQAARPGLDDAAVQALAQTAIGHNLSALLASRPTTPDNELVRRAMQGVTGDLLDENKRLWAENERLRAAGHDGQHLESVDSQNQRLVTDHGNRPVPSGEGGD